MAETFMMAGVFPMATLSAGTVRHTYVYIHKRPSLPQALQPLGVLANEILNSKPKVVSIYHTILKAGFYNSSAEGEWARFKLDADAIIANRSRSVLVDVESKVSAHDLLGAD
jgi:hypothetical protein